MFAALSDRPARAGGCRRGRRRRRRDRWRLRRRSRRHHHGLRQHHRQGPGQAGSFGKFVYPLATIAAGRQYTFRYTPQFQQLAQQGKLAMVGFGLKNGNDFHIVGLRGDGSTGLHKYKVNGTPPNGWNKDTGHTTSDGGAAANGSQAGPNYIRLVVSADGATYKFQTSPDGRPGPTNTPARRRRRSPTSPASPPSASRCGSTMPMPGRSRSSSTSSPMLRRRRRASLRRKATISNSAPRLWLRRLSISARQQRIVSRI
jgi:hypothetical protein